MKELQTIDPREPLARLRRYDLRRYAQHHKVNCHPDTPADTMRLLVKERGLDGTDWPKVLEILNKPKEGDILEDMSMSELRKLCKEKGLTQAPSDTADILRAKIRDHTA